MKVDSSAYAMQSGHLSTQRRESSDSLRVWQGSQRPDFDNANTPASPSVVVVITKKASDSLHAGTAENAVKEAESSPQLQLLKSMIEAMTGRKVRVLSSDYMHMNVTPPDIQDPKSTPNRSAGWGVEFEHHELYEETEQTGFAATGIIRTTDGKEISFSISLAMQRSYREESSLRFQAGDGIRKDPLVINFNGTAAELSDTRFQFDLDADGQAENIPLLNGGSGYLALDINGDGVINSGKELFGPTTGNGFNELARYDTDGNQWIDEADSIFQQLKIWSPTQDGNGSLTSLQDHRIGAIALEHINTPFELRTAHNTSLGEIRSTSIYLTDDGQAGTVQQIDLTV